MREVVLPDFNHNESKNILVERSISADNSSELRQRRVSPSQSSHEFKSDVSSMTPSTSSVPVQTTSNSSDLLVNIDEASSTSSNVTPSVSSTANAVSFPPILETVSKVPTPTVTTNHNHHHQLKPSSSQMRTASTSFITPLLADVDDDDDDGENSNVLGDDVAISSGMDDSLETPIMAAVQIFIPFIIAGFGMVLAGLTLDYVQHWSVFEKVPEVFILVPSLLGLKGNLEMTLASRLATQANLGNMDTTEKRNNMVVANLALIQVQAVIVGFLAACAAIVGNWINEGSWDWPHAGLLAASSTVTASLASLILSGLMCLIIIASRQCKINPDNIATPIAGCLGDLTTLIILAIVASAFHQLVLIDESWVNGIITFGFLLLLPHLFKVAYANPSTRHALHEGWTPVIAAMGISSAGGFILQLMVSAFKGFAVFQPVINGVGGNLVAVQSSRLSTALHMSSTASANRNADHHEEDTPYRRGADSEGNMCSFCPTPSGVYCHKQGPAVTSRILLAMVIPGHLIFLCLIYIVSGGHTSLTVKFALVYLVAAMLQVAILLYMCQWLVNFLYARGKDPDNCSIPYLTAVGDLLGTALLAACFAVLWFTGDKDMDVGD